LTPSKKKKVSHHEEPAPTSRVEVHEVQIHIEKVLPKMSFDINAVVASVASLTDEQKRAKILAMKTSNFKSQIKNKEKSKVAAKKKAEENAALLAWAKESGQYDTIIAEAKAAAQTLVA
jgi:hypothetical protein